MTGTNGKTPTKLTGKASSRRTNTVGFIKVDSDLNALYRPVMTKEIVGKKVRVLVPAFDQASLLREFLYLTLKDLAIAPAEQVGLPKEELHNACEALLGEFALLIQKKEGGTKLAEDETARLEEISQALLSSPPANELLIRVIRESFPDLTHPEQLTSTAKMECFNCLMDMVLNNLLV